MPRTFKSHVQTNNTFNTALGKHICLGELRSAKRAQVIPLDVDLILHVMHRPIAHRKAQRDRSRSCSPRTSPKPEAPHAIRPFALLPQIYVVIAVLHVNINVLWRVFVRIRIIRQAKLGVCEARIDVRSDDVRVALDVPHTHWALLLRVGARLALTQ